MTISTLAWILVGIGGWLVAAVVVSLVLARLFRIREERIGQDQPPMPARLPRPDVVPRDFEEPARDALDRRAPRIPQQRHPPARARRLRIGPSTRRG